MVSATLFSPEEERPRFITIKCRPPSQGMCPQPLVSGHFAVDQAESIALTQGLNEEPLRFPPHLWSSPTALSHCATINRAIYHITSGAAAKARCGTVVVLKFNELDNRATLMQGRMITQLFQPISWLTNPRQCGAAAASHHGIALPNTFKAIGPAIAKSVFQCYLPL